MRKGWFVCKILQQSEAELILQPVGHKHATRQWALDAMLKLVVAADPGVTYAIVEVDENPSWDSSSYGPRHLAVPATTP